jgi:hypothetical protein
MARTLPEFAVVGFVALLVGVAAPVRPVIGAQGATPIPDFSGIWGRNAFHFEPPPSGPVPVVNRMRKPDGGMNEFLRVGDYTNPILKPEAAAVVKRRGDTILSGASFPNPHNQCWPEPVPFTLIIQLGMQIIQQKDEVILLYLMDQKVRHVRMNVPHPAKPVPTWQGDSVGHYEGDTLVIDTLGLKVGPLSMVDQYGTPFSKGLHVIERYRLIDGVVANEAAKRHESVYGIYVPDLLVPYGRGTIDLDTDKKGLQVEVTVEDPGMFTTSWTGFVTYRHVLGDWPEVVCAENPHMIGTETHAPVAQTPDF